MKKAMKLVWAVLFALPLIAFTSCGDDDEPILDNEGDEITLTDYSDLLNKDRDEIITKKMKDFTPYYQDIDGIFYDNDGNDLGENIAEVDCFFTFEDIEANPSVVPDKESVEVMVELYDLDANTVLTYLSKKYGEVVANGDGAFTFTKGNMYVWLDIDDEDYLSISYVNKKKFDDYKNSLSTKGETFSIHEHIQALRKAAKARK